MTVHFKFWHRNVINNFDKNNESTRETNLSLFHISIWDKLDRPGSEPSPPVSHDLRSCRSTIFAIRLRFCLDGRKGLILRYNYSTGPGSWKAEIETIS